MPTFGEVVAVSRDAQLRQAERERNDQAFVEDVMQMVTEQIEAEGGTLKPTGAWTRVSENALNTYVLRFPEGCNIVETHLGVAGHIGLKKNVFMVGPTGRSIEPTEVKDRGEAVSMVMQYLLELVRETSALQR